MCVCVCVRKRPQTLRTKRVIWGYPASSYYSPGKKRKEKKAKYYKINLFFFSPVSLDTLLLHRMLNAKNFYLLASQVPTTLAFLFRYSHTSVGFTLLIDIVGEWLPPPSRSSRSRIEWHMPRNQSQLVSTGLHQFLRPVAKKSKKKKTIEKKLLREKDTTLFTFGFTSM